MKNWINWQIFKLVLSWGRNYFTYVTLHLSEDKTNVIGFTMSTNERLVEYTAKYKHPKGKV